jgi:hypothetical protein
VLRTPLVALHEANLSMAHRFRCPHCGKQTELAEISVGAPVECWACRQVFEPSVADFGVQTTDYVPLPVATIAEDEEPPVVVPLPERSSFPFALLGIGGCALLICLLLPLGLAIGWRVLPQPATSNPVPQTVEPEKPAAIIPPFAVDPALEGDSNKVFLADMHEFDVVRGPWPFTKGVLGDANESPIKAVGIRYPHGLSMHPSQEVTVRARYVLGGRCAEFHTGVAYNDYEVPSEGATTFQVLGDGTHFWSSQPIQDRKLVHECTLNVRGVEILELRVRVKGNAWNAHAVWLDPYVVKRPE